MKKIFILSTLILCINSYADPDNPTEEDAIAIVEYTAAELEKNAKQTLEDILLGKDQYWPRKDRDFYVFVLTEDVQVIASPITRFVGSPLKDVTDFNGKKYRDETVSEALKNQDGWVSLSIRTKGLIKTKKTFFKLTHAPDGEKLVVCCDIFSERGENE